MQPYDTIVIGAGVAGACSAYFLRQMGQRVLVLDKSGIAKGGSGAAGAFVSPKVGLGSNLQKITNEAFSFAYRFYEAHFPDLYHRTGVIRIPKDELDSKKFLEYEQYNTNKYDIYSSDKMQQLGITTPFAGFYFEEAGVCDAQALCHALLDGIDFVQTEVKNPIFDQGMWVIEGYRAQNLLLATGYENTLFDMRYMGVRGTWGTRGDFATKRRQEVSLHQSLSVSASMNGIIKLGATHEKSVKRARDCEDKEALGLQERAAGLVDVSDFELTASFCGMRAGSHDYFPLLGKVVDTEYMLERFPEVVKGAKPPLRYLENLFICNGLGGRGFVFGPLMGKIAAELIVKGVAVDSRVDADRLFLKWCRKSLLQ